MASTNTVFIGIDPTAGRRPLTWAVLDDRLRLVAPPGHGPLTEALAAVAAYPAAVVAVDAPFGPNHGLMADPTVRTRLGLPPAGARWRNCKVAEYELRRRNLRLYLTPDAHTAPAGWVQLGYTLYGALGAVGFEAFAPASGAARQMLEVFPHAGYAVLLGRRPLPKHTLEGRLQRQVVLADEGVAVPDPLEALEELTRQHLREGALNFPGLFTHDELDALVAAYTAYLAAREPERLTLVGEAPESQIGLPVAPAEFKDFYR